MLSHVYPDGTERPIQYASQSLTETQKGYSQIDKEAYGIIFGIKKFHQYLYGNRFTLVTDHRPLTQIFNPQKGLPAYSAIRMQHYAIFLRAFNFNIKYRKSSEHGNADCLSRLPVPVSKPHNLNVIDVYLLENIETLPITARKIEQETRNDPILSKWLKILKTGNNLNKLDLKYEEFSLRENIILRKERVVIPSSLHNEILKELHAGHFGTMKMKNLARRFCWWKNIDKDIKSITKNCRACSSYQNNPIKQKTSMGKRIGTF